MFSEKIYLSEGTGMKYDAKTSKLTFVSNMSLKLLHKRISKSFHVCKINNCTNKSAF